MIETSTDLPRKSSVNFGNLGRCSETCVRPSDNFWRISKIFGKWSEIFRKWAKTSLPVCVYNKQNNTWLLVDMKYPFPQCSGAV